MSPLRARLLDVTLWVCVLAWSLWWGGTVFQMLVVVPLWSAAPPESVRSFFGTSGYTHTINNFFGPPWMLVRTLPVVASVILAWPLRRHRTYALITLGTLIIGLVMTLAYVYPINAVLVFQAGGTQSAEEIREMVTHWLFADRVRFAIMTVGYIALLRAFKTSIASGRILECRPR